MRLARGLFGRVDRLPTGPCHGVGGALGIQRRGVVRMGHRRGVERTGLGVFEDPGDGIARVFLVGANYPRRAALDPSHDILAALRTPVFVDDAACLVADQAPALVERNVVNRPAAVADRAQHKAAVDDLFLPGRDSSEPAMFGRFYPVLHHPDPGYAAVFAVTKDLNRRAEEAQGPRCDASFGVALA